MLLAGRQQRQVVADARQICAPCSPSAHLALQLPSTPSLFPRLDSQTPPAAAAPAAPAAEEASPIPHRLKKRRAVNYWGLFVYLFFIAAFGFYIWARAAHTLGLGPMLWCGGAGGGAGSLPADGLLRSCRHCSTPRVPAAYPALPSSLTPHAAPHPICPPHAGMASWC